MGSKIELLKLDISKHTCSTDEIVKEISNKFEQQVKKRIQREGDFTIERMKTEAKIKRFT